MKYLVRALVLAAGALAIPLIPAGPAVADHGGGNTVAGYLWTKGWKVCRGGSATLISAVDRAIGLINASDVDAAAVSCSAGTSNLNVWTSTKTTSDYAWTWCDGTLNSTTRQCSFMKVLMHPSNIASTPNPAKQWQKTACHELGHVGGLDHRPTDLSCLKSGYSPPIYSIYDAHDISSLNATYP